MAASITHAKRYTAINFVASRTYLVTSEDLSQCQKKKIFESELYYHVGITLSMFNHVKSQKGQGVYKEGMRADTTPEILFYGGRLYVEIITRLGCVCSVSDNRTRGSTVATHDQLLTRHS